MSAKDEREGEKEEGKEGGILQSGSHLQDALVECCKEMEWILHRRAVETPIQSKDMANHNIRALLCCLQRQSDVLVSSSAGVPDEERLEVLRDFELELIAVNSAVARVCDELSCVLFAYYCKLRQHEG